MSKKANPVDEQRKHRFRFETPHWFELMSACPPEAIERLQESESLPLAFLEKYRVFVRGRLDKMFWIEVPSDMPSDQVQQLGETLANQGVDALIVSDQIRFVKLRMCAAEEEQVLDEYDTAQKGKITISRGAPSGDVSGPGSLGDGGGNSGSGRSGEASSPGDGSAEEEH